jgi:signal transduction histidine kinase
MLEPAESFIATEFEQGRFVGQEEESIRIVQMFHDEVSSPLTGSLFAIEMARHELEGRGLPQAEKMAQASELLTEASEKLREVLAKERGENGLPSGSEEGETAILI